MRTLVAGLEASPHTRKGKKNAYGSKCHFGKFPQGKGCPGKTVMVIGDNRLCAHHAKILEEIVRDANRETARHPRYCGKKAAA